MTALSECDWSSFHQEMFNQQEGLECLSTILSSVIDRLAPLKVVRSIKGHDPWLDCSLINLRRKRDTASRRHLRARVNYPHSEMTTKLEKKYEVLRDDFNTRSTLAQDAFMQTKISHALDTNKNCVWCELKNLGLLPQQREKLHGIEPDALNSHLHRYPRQMHVCLMIVTKSSHKPVRMASDSLQQMPTMLFWQWLTSRRRLEVATAFNS